MEMDSGFVVVRTFTSQPQADLAKSALDAAGIETFVFSDDAGGLQPGLWEGQGISLVVRAEDANSAREILDTAARPIE
jgi:hypothetical protein